MQQVLVRTSPCPYTDVRLKDCAQVQDGFVDNSLDEKKDLASSVENGTSVWRGPGWIGIRKFLGPDDTLAMPLATVLGIARRNLVSGHVCAETTVESSPERGRR